MIDLVTVPMLGRPCFSCSLEMYLWLARHKDEPPVAAWWMGFEFAQRGVTFERVLWELENNTERYRG